MALKKWAASVRDANVGPQKSRRKCPILAGAANVRAANVRAANVRDANVGNGTPTKCRWHCQVCRHCPLLLQIQKFEPALISATIDEVQPKLCAFLGSTTVEARISAGDALCALFEIGLKNLGDDFRFRNHAELVDVLADLALDSSKQRAKRDKKLQRMTFRQRMPCQTVVYDALCQLLRSDLNRHLTTNEVVRELFDLPRAQ
ncbi:hypothetical protein niasHT_010389 [Heterodera trifolii]|uniref:Interferon-related developmental regulator N-terminal domain-containing protein n=1 Tax=Heterodera trifolii TaxID=157864 RepID=A0ABD2MBH6_9BILA